MEPKIYMKTLKNFSEKCKQNSIVKIAYLDDAFQKFLNWKQAQ